MLEGRTYAPLLHARLAEMRALRELPTNTKNAIFPVIKIRPWLNARTLAKVFDVIQEAVGDRAYGLDLDDSRNIANAQRQAYQEFSRLFDSSDGYSQYYECVARSNNIVPVLRLSPLDLQLERQIDHIENLDRGVVIRVTTQEPGQFLEIASYCLYRNIRNVLFVFDCGWRTDVLTQSATCAGLLESLMDVSEHFEVVVAGSSFPQSFSGLGERFDIPVAERLLFQEVRRSVNRGSLTYGDWGSTRPPTAPVPMRNIPRIDIARGLNWTSWRSVDGETYADVAERVIEDAEWDGNIGVWGEYMIQSTAEGLDPAVRSPAMAAAVRVNLHMHIQANYDNPQGLAVQDEPVGDDL
ncbi:hypothetical protein U1708_14920 [Sphingomonas sp. ZB1N12]|uniref:beta family protein n=1 Tax=Sphingomonas arabinosi TaxID=3096160 RepID=UPI002FC80A06